MNGTKKQALLITTQVEFAKVIRTILANNSIEINTRYEALASPAVIHKAYQNTGNTVFVRKAFSRLVAEEGVPYLIIIDYRIFLTSDLREDPDMRKIFKTLLISYIFMHSESTTPIPANFVLIDVGEKGSGATEIEKNPASVLDIIETDNSNINAMVNAYKKNLEKFNSIFRFVAISPKSEYQEVKTKLDGFFALIDAKSEKTTQVQQSAMPDQSTTHARTNATECMTVFKNGSYLVIINGEETTLDAYPDIQTLPDVQIHVRGHWGKATFQDTCRKIQRTIEITQEKNAFDETGEIVLNLSKNCSVEPQALSFLVLLVNNAKAMGIKCKILIDFKNSMILEKAQGYRLISPHIIHCF